MTSGLNYLQVGERRTRAEDLELIVRDLGAEVCKWGSRRGFHKGVIWLSVEVSDS